MLQMGVTNDSPIAPTATAGMSLRQAAMPFAFLATFASVIAPALADEVAAVVADKVVLGPIPSDWGLKYEYYADSQKVVNHMRYAVQMEKGNPDIATVASKTKDEINDFVSYYRRFQGISGKQSFSLLYTSINVLAGHYTSYGTSPIDIAHPMVLPYNTSHHSKDHITSHHVSSRLVSSYLFLLPTIHHITSHILTCTSYGFTTGVKFPVPEKRRKRLLQEFNDIEKNCRKKR